MNKKLVNEVRQLLKGRPKDEFAIYYALTDLFYRIGDCDMKNRLIPKKNAVGLKDEHKLLKGECYSLANGVYVYF